MSLGRRSPGHVIRIRIARYLPINEIEDRLDRAVYPARAPRGGHAGAQRKREVAASSDLPYGDSRRELDGQGIAAPAEQGSAPHAAANQVSPVTGPYSCSFPTCCC